ncbi:MAG TPA: DUF6079 family protein [Pyrinomonadaceae bacterium]|jgi:hypothetical protein
MKRAPDKIKDYVEPQAFDEVSNLTAEPARALAAYRFTDVTSDLLARWLDALADLPRGRGTARALAGVRGVGKSHTLAVFGALAASSELRSQVRDAHVATSARRLLGRRYMVIHVERGLRPTLLEEISDALGAAFGGDPAQWGEDPMALLAVAASRSLDATLVLIIDTASTREMRVKRDDGPILSQLAQAAQNVNAFVALALDDDIADASGVNSVLAAAYAIDYLDPEHLYRIADQYLLRKNPQARAALHEIYLSLRSSVPGFNWSEPRFAALYPVHPLVADVAASVRLYAPRFAFLPFAASAAARAAGRPALSLILLDEVFDRAEHDLRQSPELPDAFKAYDQLSTSAVTQLPVMQRLQARLVLKSLFIHSLDGRGASVGELCAGLLLSNETADAFKRIEEMLALFIKASPDALGRSGEGGEARYRFQISASTKFDDALAESVERAPLADASAIEDLLRAIARSRFDDWPLADELKDAAHASADFRLNWRGSERPGKFIWPQSEDEIDSPPDAASTSITSHLEWQLRMLAPATAQAASTDNSTDASSASSSSNNADSRADASHVSDASLISFDWRPAELTPEESNALRRLVALRADARLVADYGEKAHAAASILNAQAERIWTRIYMNDGALLNAVGEPRRFTDAARAARTLASVLSETFAPLFDVRYPEHPRFAETLGDLEVARLVDGFLGNLDMSESGMQHLAAVFAEPLGLAVRRGDTYTLETGDEALANPCVRGILALTDAASDGEVVPLEEVRRVLHREPYGLLRFTQQLILAALVAQRRIELVTETGDRISRRTLSRSLKWEDVAGICRAAAIHHNAEELTAWARLLTAQPSLASIAEPEARRAVRVALDAWLDRWRERGVLERFNSLPDDAYTTRSWNTAGVVRKSFGAAADTLEATLAGDVSLEEGLQRIADAFGGSTEVFERSAEQLEQLASFIEGFAERERQRAYLCFAEPTARGDIESARRELLAIADDAHSLFERESGERFNLLWREFHARYTERYASAHERARAQASDPSALEELLRRERFREFELLSQLSIVNQRYSQEAGALLARARRAACELPVRQILETRPTCACSFRLSESTRLSRLAGELEEIVELGLAAYRRTLAHFSKQLRHALDALAAREQDAETASRARALANALAVGLIPEHLSRVNVRLIDRAIKTMSAPPPLRVHSPTGGCGLLTREELSARLRQWLDDLPDHTALVEIVQERETDAA